MPFEQVRFLKENETDAIWLENFLPAENIGSIHFQKFMTSKNIF